MRLATISVLSFFAVIPAFAGARLPVVNVGAAGVSARSAFGDTTTQSTGKLYGELQTTPKTHSITPRPAVQTKQIQKTSPSVGVDSGEQIVANADILRPQRPYSDLWVDGDTPLRMPSANEFAVLRSDELLPEESLFATTTTTPRDTDTTILSRNSMTTPMSEIDAQIARLNDLQRRVDTEIANARRIPTTTTDVAQKAQSARTVVGRVPDTAPAPKIAQNTTPAVKLSRLVVPMTEEVIERPVAKTESPRIAAVRNDMAKLSPTELRKAFRKTFLSENKHLSTYSIDDRFDVASDIEAVGFTSERGLTENTAFEGGNIRPLEIKIKFRNEDAALSRENYNLLSQYAQIVLANPTRAVQVAIPQDMTNDSDGRKLAARRLAIVEQVLRDNGVSEQRIMPVLSTRNTDSFVFRMISSEQYDTMTQQQKNIFGDTVKKKTYKNLSW